MSKKFLIAAALLAVLAFAIPIEHKYDKLFRYFSSTLVPQELEVSKNYDKKIYFYLSDLASLALLGMALLWWRIPLKRFFGNPLWIVFFCALISIIASPFIQYPIPYTRLLHFLTPFILFSFLTTALSEEETKKTTQLIWIAIVSAGLLQSAIGIAQYFHQAPLGLRILGETKQSSAFAIHDGSRWLIDKWLHRTASTNIVLRAAGTFPHSNPFGGFMVLSSLATYALILQIPKWKWTLGLTLPFQFFAMSLSYSRAAFFAWGLANLVWFSLMIAKRGIRDRMVRFITTVVIFPIAIVIALLFHQCIHRGGLINYNSLAHDSDHIRHLHQKTAFQIMKDRPWTGLGFTQFSERAGKYLPQNASAYARSTGPHNIFLFLACETGLISLAAFLSWIALLLWRAVRATMTVEVITLLAILVAFLFISFCDFYLILFHQGILMFFITAGLLAAHVKKKQNPKMSTNEMEEA